MSIKPLLTAAVMALVGCSPSTATPSPDKISPQNMATSGQHARDWCDVYACEICPTAGCPPGGHRASYCCPLSGFCGARHGVEDGTLCPEGTFLVICNWGMTNDDGSFTCYDQP